MPDSKVPKNKTVPKEKPAGASVIGPELPRTKKRKGRDVSLQRRQGKLIKKRKKKGNLKVRDKLSGLEFKGGGGAEVGLVRTC